MPITPETQESLLGPTVIIRGEVTAQHQRLTIMGTVEGNVNHDQSLTVHRDGNIEGEIWAREVIVEGTVNGNIHGINRVKITNTGSVNGNVYSQRFSVDEGASIKGSVIMDADPEETELDFPVREPSSREALPAKQAGAKPKAGDSIEPTDAERRMTANENE